MRSNEARTFADEARRRQIIGCAIDLIAETGYPQTSLAKIADRAGIAKSVVLYHFTNKDELVAEIVTEVFGRSAALMVPAVSAAASATDRLTAYIEANGAFLDANRTAAIALYDISISYRSADGLRFDQAVQRDVDEAGIPPEFALLDPRAIIEDGLGSGEFTSDRRAADIADALRAALDGAVSVLSRNPDHDVLGYVATIRSVFLAALTGTQTDTEGAGT